MVTHPLDTVQRCVGFLGLPMTDACRDYLSDKINPAKVGQYRENDPALIAQVESAIGDDLAACGYSIQASEHHVRQRA